MSLGNNIKRIRKERGLTQKELAEKLQVNINTIQNYENGRREPKFKVIENLSKILDVSYSEFYSDEDPIKKKENIEKLECSIPENQKNNIYWRPSTLKYEEKNEKAMNILNEFLKSDVMQDDCEYHYESLMMSPGIDEIYIFIQNMIRLKYSSNMNTEDIAIELLLNSCGSYSHKFNKDELKIIKDTILNYTKGIIEFKRINK